jgi:seryl-tRNA synthetase
MHDIRAIRDNPDAFDAGLARRGLPAEAARLLALDAERRRLILLAETATAAQNRASKEVGAAKARGDEDAFARLRAEIAATKADIALASAEADAKDADLRDALARLPNTPLDSVPDGADETGNVELHRWGTPRRFDFPPREHFDIPGAKAGLDFETAGKVSGARFVFLSGAVARVQRALAQFMLDLHITEHGLTETWTPVLVRPEAMFGTDKLPKFGEDSYQTTDGRWLVPTSEVTLTYSVAEAVLEASALPIRMTAHTQCFRSEAGSAGKDTAGMLRQHQFEKVEMVTICTPETALDEQERMRRAAETVLERLGLPYRTIVLCTGDMGFGAQRTYDLEVWLPGQDTYREISSVSTTGQFQARRMNARYRAAGGKPEFVATLNGSGLAVGRCLIAVLENGQEADGSVTLPEALAPYLGGKGRIDAEGRLV